MLDYFGNMPAVAFSPWLLLFTAIIAFLLSSLMYMILQLIFAPLFGCKVAGIEVMGFSYQKQKTGKWEYMGHKHKIGFNADFNIDLEKFKDQDVNKIKTKETMFLITCAVIEFIIAVGVFIVCVIAEPKISSGVMAAIVFDLGLGYLVFTFVRCVIHVIVLSKFNSKNSLSSYTQSAITMIRTGVPFEKLDLKPYWELNFKNVLDAEKIAYFPFYFAYLDSAGQYDKMAAAVGDVENALKPTSSSRVDMFTIITLVYYYSYHYIDIGKAKEYYLRAGDMLAKDTDSNGMRIKGFYELNCFGNVEKAKECAANAAASVDTFSIGTEREYERTCIAKLNDAISRFQGQ